MGNGNGVDLTQTQKTIYYAAFIHNQRMDTTVAMRNALDRFPVKLAVAALAAVMASDALAGILEARSEWITGATQQGEGGMETFVPRRNPILGRSLYVHKPVSRATAEIAALGFFDFTVNSCRLTSSAVTQWTPYRERILSDTFDLTPHLSVGTNRLELALGNGWRNPYPLENFGLRMRRTLAVGDPCVKVWIRIEYADGCVEDIVSGDGKWEAAEGDVVYNSVYMGERRDMRLSDRNWVGARVVEGADGKIERNEAPPVTVRGVHSARSVTPVRKGTWLVDFGENRTGVVRARLRGLKAGDEVSFRLGEALTNGVLYARSACYGQIPYAEQVDSVIAAGPGEFVFEPRFTFHGFRYAEVSGLSAMPSLDDLMQEEMSSAVAETGAFECSNQRLNAIHRICRRTFLNNIMSLQSDCPAREKYGYGADVAASAEAFICNFDMRAFYRKVVRDNLDEARADGWFTDTAPYIGINDGGYGGRSGGIGWAMGVPVLADLLYAYYGDAGAMAEAYPAMARYALLLEGRFPDGAIPRCIGDHLALDKMDDAMSAQANFVRYLDMLSVFAKRLGREEDHAEWARKAAKAKERFRARHIRGGQAGERLTQGAQAMALRYGLFQPSERARASSLLADAVSARGNALSTGLQCTNFLLEELAANGLWKEAAAVVSREEFPGWLHMERNGATTLWERWPDPKPIHSFDHPMFGHVDAWLTKYILGIRLAQGAVGGDRVVVDPHPLCGVTWAKGALGVGTGTVYVEWRKRPDGTLDISCRLPKGVTLVEK